MYSQLGFFSVFLAISVTTFAAPAPNNPLVITTPPPSADNPVSKAVAAFKNDIAIVSASLNSLSRIYPNEENPFLVTNLVVDIDNAERDEDQHREILIAAATNPSLVKNETVVNAANRANDIIKEHVNGVEDWGVPVRDSFFGRLKSIQEKPTAEGVSALAIAIGKDRNENILPNIKILMNLALDANPTDETREEINFPTFILP